VFKFISKIINIYKIIMTTDSDSSNILESSPSVVNINITCHSGSSVVITNNLTVPENINNEEFVPITQPQSQPQPQPQPQPHTTQNLNNTPINTSTPSGLEPSTSTSTSTSSVLFAVNPSTNNQNNQNNQNINNITQNLLNSLFSGTNNTITETVTFIPNIQSVQQMQPPSDGLNLNDLRNYTTLTTHLPNTHEIKCEICHDTIQNGDILRMINVCNHSFHQECVDSWFENNQICPYCRCNVIEEPINNNDNDNNNVNENT
jgi:hypothetical protein